MLFINIYIIKKGFSPFDGGINFSLILMFPNIFMVTALATFFGNLRSKVAMLGLNVLGIVIAVLGTLLGCVMLTIQC